MNKAGNENTMSYGKRVRLLLAPFFGITYMVFFFAETESYFANLGEWHFTYGSILPAMLLICAVIFGISVLLTARYVRSPRAVERLSVFGSSLMTMMYVQNIALNGNGFISGEMTEQSSAVTYLNLFFWAVLLLGPQFLMANRKMRKKLLFGSIFLSAALTVIQLAPLPVLLLTLRDSGAYRLKDGKRLLGDDQYTVSSGRNVVVFILDAYYNGLFDDYLAGNEDAYERLKDFTYYDNVVTNACYTVFSIPYMLTASDVDFEVSIKDSNRQAWQGENAEYFYTTLKNAGYQTFLYTDSAEYAGGYENMEGLVQNLGTVRLDTVTNPWVTYFMMLKLSMYRYMPFLLKQPFYVYDSSEINLFTKVLFEDEEVTLDHTGDPTLTARSSAGYGVEVFNYDYYPALQEGLTEEAGCNRLIIEHLWGMHIPYLGLDGSSSVTDAEEETICMDIVYEYMEQLKQLGLYDDTCIIVTADHGFRDIYRSDPLMLIKGFGEHGDRLRIDHAPGCLQSDLLPTILDLLGEDPAGISGGESLLRLEEDEQRTRFIRDIGDRPELPRRPKCNGAGYSVYNSYEEFRFEGRSSEIDEEQDSVGVFPIYDYWW